MSLVRRERVETTSRSRRRRFLRLADFLELREQRTELRLLGAMRGDDQKRRRVRWTQQLRQQGRAVAIAPLHVVEKKDHAPVVRHARQELAQRRERAAAQLLRVADVDLPAPPFRQLLHLLQHRKETRQRRGVGGISALPRAARRA